MKAKERRGQADPENVADAHKTSTGSEKPRPRVRAKRRGFTLDAMPRGWSAPAGSLPADAAARLHGVAAIVVGDAKASRKTP